MENAANPTPQDSELVEAASAGSCAAFERLVERYHGMVYMVAFSRVGHRETAEDLAQESFLRAYLFLCDLNEPRRFAGWITRITRNLAEEWLRKGQRRSQLATMVSMNDVGLENMANPQSQGWREQMEVKEDASALREAVFDLPPDQREVVLLHYGEGLSKAEIASRLDVHPATVGRQIERAVRALRGTLEPALSGAMPALRATPVASARALTLAASAAALSAPAKSSMAAAAGGKAWIASVGMGAQADGLSASSTGLLKTFVTSLGSGGKTMGAAKAAVALLALAVIGGYAYNLRNGPDKALTQFEGAGALPTIKQVIAGIVANDRSIATYAVESHTRIQYPTPRKGIPESEEYTAQIWAKGALYRYEKEGHFIYRPDHPVYNFQGKAGRFDEHRQSAYDGRVERELNYIEKTGYIREIGNARALPASHPMFLGISMSRLPAVSREGTGTALSRKTFSVTGTETVDGHTALKMEGPIAQNPDGKAVLFIDPARSYRLVKRVLCSKTDPYGVVNTDEYKNFTEVSPGIFLPTVIQTLTNKIDRDTRKEIVYTSETTTLDLKTLAVDKPMDNSSFRVGFPAGWPVYDEVKGRKSVQGQASK